MNIGTKEAVALGIPYLISVGACYLFGYWGAFHINVLEFISFADVAKLAIYPLLASLSFFLAGVVSAEIARSPSLSPGGGSSSKLGIFGRKHWRLLLTLQIFLAVLVAALAPEPGKWFVVAILITLLSTPLTHVEFLIDLVPNPRVRATVLFLSLLLPTFSFAYGRLQAFMVQTGASEQFVDVVRSKIPLAGDEKNQVAYLGFLGSVYVLRESKTGQIVMVKQRDDSPLFLVPKSK